MLFVACSGSPTVARVNEEPITAAEVTALSAETPSDLVIAGDPFRRVLSLLIVNLALSTAAEAQFGLEDLDNAERIAVRIAHPPPAEQSVFDQIAADPRLTTAYAEGAAEYFMIRDAVLAEIVTEEVDDAAIQELFGAWADEAVASAEVEVRSQVGSWGGSGVGVLPPPS
jgi:hypothetical protein